MLGAIAERGRPGARPKCLPVRNANNSCGGLVSLPFNLGAFAVTGGALAHYAGSWGYSLQAGGPVEYERRDTLKIALEPQTHPLKHSKCVISLCLTLSYRMKT